MRRILEHTLLFAALVGSAWFATRLISLPATNLTAIWFPAGIAVIALLTRPGWSAIPTIFLANWAIIALNNHYPFFSLRPLSLLLCAGNTAQAAIAVGIWRNYLKGPPFSDGWDFLRFAFGVALLPAVLTGWIPIAIVHGVGRLPPTHASSFVLQSGIIAMSDALGIFLLVPLALAPAPAEGSRLKLAAAGSVNFLIAIGVCALSLRVAGAAFWLAVPAALFAAVSCGPRGVAISVLTVTIGGLWATAHGIGPFSMYGAPYHGMFEMDAFAFCVAIPGAFAGIVVEQLREHRSTLEQTVQARTWDLARAKEAAEAASRAKSDFLAATSHEIRTPLNGVMGFARLLQSSRLEGEQREFVDAIVASSRTLLTILNDILDLSKIEAGAVELEVAPYSPAGLARDAARLFASSAAEKGVRIEEEIGSSVPDVVLGDAGRVSQVLANLVSNAVKFTERGTITIRVAAQELPPSVGGGETRHRLEFAVQDTGIGISEEQMPRLFRKYGQAEASTSRRYGGTGLGLSISKRLCERMGGDLVAASVPGGGSLFTARIVAQEAPPIGRALRLLVAEDDALSRRLVEEVLRRQGHEVVVSGTGQETIERALSDEFDAVLMDMQLPDMDGIAATRRIRDRESEAGRPRIPIVALTGDALAEHREACRAAGMDGFITKPLDPDSLAAAIKSFRPARVL